MSDRSFLAKIEIFNTDLMPRERAGIGASSKQTEIARVQLLGNISLSYEPTVLQSCLIVQTIKLSQVSLIARVNSSKLFNSTPRIFGACDLLVRYSVELRQEPVVGIPILYFGHVEFPGSLQYELVISNIDEFER
jgi:hypothetical protein